MNNEMMPALETNNGSLDWENTSVEQTKAELKSIFDSLISNLDQVKAMTEIAQERNFQLSPEAQAKAKNVLEKFEPGGEYAPILYNMISDIGSITSTGFSEGLHINAEELNSKLEEMKNR